MAASQGEMQGRLPSLAKYEIIEEIGHGGMATVYRARDPRLARDVAIKVIHPHLRDSTEIAHRFHIEAQAVAKLRHPNIVEVFDVSDARDREQYLVVELVRGRTLRQVLAERSPMPPEIAAAIALELTAALTHAHDAGVVHRDIKPENVLIETGANAVKIKLTDFGIAKLLDAKGVTSTGQVLGSPAHMAPEQIEGGEVDARNDVFGLGVLLYECMVGHLPFEGTNPAQVLRRVLDGDYAPAEHEHQSVGRAWSGQLDRALARNVAERTPSAAEMRAALEGELARLGITDPPAEISAYMAGPDAYEAAHARSMIERLTALAQRARAKGDVLTAACDYNRALSYAPADPALLRIVGAMHRERSRGELLRRAAPAVGLLLAAGALGYGVSRSVTGRRPAMTDAGAAAVVAIASLPDASLLVSVAPEPPSFDAQAPPVRTAPTVMRAPLPAPLPNARQLSFVRVMPVAGVVVTIDDGQPINIGAGSTLPIDTRPHVLRFACVLQDACEPDTRTIAAGSFAGDLAIELKIRPATLLVLGQPDGHYYIDDYASIDVRAGVPARVPVSRAVNNYVTVIDRDSKREQKVNLSAGKEARVTFAAP